MPDVLTVTVPDLPTVSQVTGDELIAVYTGNRLSKMPQAALRGTRLSSGPTTPPVEPSVLVDMAPLIGDRWRNTETGDEWKITSLDPVTWTPDGNIIGPAGADGTGVGPPGEPGKKGAKGDKGDLVTKTIGATLPNDCAVVVLNDLLYPADVTDIGHFGLVIGVVQEGGAPGEQATAQSGGDLDGVGGTFSPLDVLYPASDGTLTRTPPASPAAKWTQSIGTASTGSHIVVRLGEARVLADDGDALIFAEGGYAFRASQQDLDARSTERWMAPADLTKVPFAQDGETAERRLPAQLALKANVTDLAAKADLSALAGKANLADLAAKADLTDIATTPYVRDDGVIATPLYLRKTLAKIDVEDFVKASGPIADHRAGWQAALNRLVALGGGSLKAPDAPYTFTDVTQSDIYNIDGDGNLVVARKGFVLLVSADVDLDLALHRHTRLIAGPAIRTSANGVDGISTTPADKIKSSGALLGIYRAGQPTNAPLRQISVTGGIVDVSKIAGSATSVDGIAVSGAFNLFTERTEVYHGTTTPVVLPPGTPGPPAGMGSGTVGSGGGDSSWFVSDCAFVEMRSNRCIGPPDLGVYLSGDGIVLAKIIDLEVSNALSCVAGKRGAKRIEIINPNFHDCQNGVFGGTTGDVPLGHTREIYIQGGKMTRMQGDPVRFDLGLNGAVDGTAFEDTGRLLADPTLAFARSSNNRAAAIKLDGASRCAVRNIDVRFTDWIPSLVPGREFVGVCMAPFLPTGASSKDCQFSGNRFAGKDGANPLFADYVADAGTINLTFDAAPSLFNVVHPSDLILGTGHQFGKALRVTGLPPSINNITATIVGNSIRFSFRGADGIVQSGILPTSA